MLEKQPGENGYHRVPDGHEETEHGVIRWCLNCRFFGGTKKWCACAYGSGILLWFSGPKVVSRFGLCDNFEPGNHDDNSIDFGRFKNYVLRQYGFNRQRN